MEADWEFEIGADAPVIDACWPGFIDLRWSLSHACTQPERTDQEQVRPESEAEDRVRGFSEVTAFPALGKALVRLNGPISPVWTSKCDFWPTLEAPEFDPDELNAPDGHAHYAAGGYIDMLPRSERQWLNLPEAASDCKLLCRLLHDLPLPCCRVDLVIRRAVILPTLGDIGITAYLTGCGRNSADASQAVEMALAAFVNAICARTTLQ